LKGAHRRANRLYYSDARNGGVFRRSPDGSIETLTAGRKMVGGIGFEPRWRIDRHGRDGQPVDEKTGRLTKIFAEWKGKPLFGMNDLTIEDQAVYGRYLRHRHYQFDFKSTPPPGFLFRIDRREDHQAVGKGGSNNGLGFSPDRKLALP